MNKQNIIDNLTLAVNVVCLAFSLWCAIEINGDAREIRALLKSPPFTQEALGTYPAEKPKFMSKEYCVKVISGYSASNDVYRECVVAYPESIDKPADKVQEIHMCIYNPGNAEMCEETAEKIDKEWCRSRLNGEWFILPDDFKKCISDYPEFNVDYKYYLGKLEFKIPAEKPLEYPLESDTSIPSDCVYDITGECIGATYAVPQIATQEEKDWMRKDFREGNRQHNLKMLTLFRECNTYRDKPNNVAPVKCLQYLTSSKNSLVYPLESATKDKPRICFEDIESVEEFKEKCPFLSDFKFKGF